MKKLLLVLFITPMLFTSCNDCNCEVDGRKLIDATPLEAKAQLMKEAFANKDVDGMLELFTEDMFWEFPNGERIEGKEQARTVFTSVFSQWEEMRMDSGGEENPPVVIATERDNGRWLLRWSPYYYKATNGKEITLSNHNGIWFGDDDKIKGIYTFYDRNELSKMYDEEDPLETVE